MEFNEDERLLLMCAILDEILKIKQYLFSFPNEKDKYEEKLKCLNSLQKRMSDYEL